MRSFKRVIFVVLFIIVCIICNSILNFILIPNNYVRMNINNIENTRYDDLFVGSSHGFSSIDPVTLDSVTGRKSTNFCLGGEYLRDSYYILKYASRNGNKPERLIYELDPQYWINPDTENENYGLVYNTMSPSLVKVEYFFAKILDTDFRGVLFPWFYYRDQYSSMGTNFRIKKGHDFKKCDPSILDSPSQEYRKGGFLFIKNRPGEHLEKQDIILWDESKILEDQEKYFDKIVEFCKDNQIELVVITTPVPKKTLKENYENYKEENEYFTKLMEQKGVAYYDFNFIETPEFDKENTCFSDYEGHMNGDSAIRFSKVLGEYLK